MKIWIVCIGEPLPIDGENTRLRRMGNLAKYVSEKTNDEIIWFSDSFEHYTKKYRCLDEKSTNISRGYFIELINGCGYEKNISLKRIKHYKKISQNLNNRMYEKEKPNIIITTMAPLEVTEVVVEYGKKENIPVITDIRDLWPEIYYEILPKYTHMIIKPYVNICKKKLEFIMNNSYGLIGLSEYFLNYGLKYAKREKKVIDKVFPISYPNYNYENYKNKFDSNWSKYGLSKDDFIVTFMGNFGKQFDFSSIVKASHKLKNNENIKFVLCGLGEQLELIKEKCANNVIFPGWIEKEEISSLLSNTDIGIAPYIDSINYRNNTPNKFGEYLSAGIPILVSVNGEMESLLIKNECGFVYKNEEQLVEQINTYIKNKEMLSEHKMNSRNLYEKHFNSDIAYEKMYRHLECVVNEYHKN